MTDPRFVELKPPLGSDEALAESSRCLFCYDAPCTRACPTHIDVPAFIKKIATGNVRGSARTIFDANVLGASCARVCPTEVLCEGACVMNDLHARPIDIGRLQRYATDWAMEKNAVLWETPAAASKAKVAVVGAGPSGLACAVELRNRGHEVVVFEAHEKPGGLNSYGVAEYKMTQGFALKEVDYVLQRGVEVRTKTRVGTDITIAQLEMEFAAIFLGVGLGGARQLGIPGEDLPGVTDALAFIGELKKNPQGAKAPGRRVAVIGGGNTAIDAVTQSVRLGAEEVTLVYRRGPEEMSAYDHEQELARKDGVRFLFQAVPVRILAKDPALAVKPGPVDAGSERSDGLRPARSGSSGLDGPSMILECVRVELGAPDASGRRSPKAVAGSEFKLDVDVIIRAAGQTPHETFFGLISGLTLKNGRVAVDSETFQTSNPRYFAGGDCANGGKEVVNAVAEGKRAALGIAKWLEARRG